MTKEKTKNIRKWYWYDLLPWLFLAILLSVTYYVWQVARANEFVEKENEFQAQVSETAGQLASQVSVYEQALYGMRSLFDASEFVTEQEFKLFVHEMLNSRLSTGLHQVGFAKLVNPLNLKTYQRLEPKFHHEVMQLNQQTLHAPVIYVASKQGHSKQALISNAFERPQLRKDMEFTARTNTALISESIGLDSNADGSGLAMILPVYIEPFSNQRRVKKALQETDGWVFANLDLDTIFQSVFEQGGSQEISYRLYKRLGDGVLKLLHQQVGNEQNAGLFSDQRVIEVFGQQWELSASSLKPFEERLDYTYSNKVALLGLFATIAFTSILFLIVTRLHAFGQLKESEEKIWQHANFDYLTNLPNRRMLYNRLEREIDSTKRRGTKLALLFLDLDGFKEINDTLGHDQGDMLLQQTGARLTECTYSHDVVARLGGDEFIVLVSDVEQDNIKNIEYVAQKILNTLAEPFVLEHEKAFVTASMGIAIYPDDSTSIDGLIRNVDQAMYASKARGGNCFTYFTPIMQENALKRLRLSNDLRVALEQQQLFVEYQPIVNLSSGEIYKAEALLRWQHPEKGLISPAEFIPIAEDMRMINEIGNWVFIEAVQQCKVWRETVNQRFQIAVNKSAVQFMNADPKHSEWITALPTIPGENDGIVIEITESLLLETSGHVGEKLRDYRSKGIKIALDDFGTGYSSLSYLRKFEIDYLKIDQSFVANLEESTEDRVLCQAIIVMAHSLGIKVIAEGIETEKQKNILLEAGCDYGQGYYFSRSLLPSDFEAYVEE